MKVDEARDERNGTSVIIDTQLKWSRPRHQLSFLLSLSLSLGAFSEQ